MQPEIPLVLASASPARRALLGAAGIEVEVQPAAIDEVSVKAQCRAEGSSTDDCTLLLADLKARRIARTRTDAIVIGCDQLLVCDGIWFDKPASVAEARGHLQTLRGCSHTLVTAVLCRRGDQRLWHHIAHPRLTMRRFSDSFLDAYLAEEGTDVCATVGAYRLEGRGIHLFERIEGDHSAILGLPLLPLLGFLRQHGVLPA